ncbi:hypothetical protein J6590_040387 [Homalodisca vitripennis]|nr:hypothetical protein J6590_040387 [Homalodisca vitripennis]
MAVSGSTTISVTPPRSFQTFRLLLESNETSHMETVCKHKELNFPGNYERERNFNLEFAQSEPRCGGGVCRANYAILWVMRGTVDRAAL